ncbi:DEAD/DEAH box helicase [Phenylobacterium sp.]|uniref:DEAD/DEAH box helicase n=1 Tax=Phenylobacterium sp. TaxID=1871053 RepID=UPI003982EE54
MTEFSELGLSDATLKAVAETGYTTATPIQAEAIPVALQGLDILGIAQTGTGKTAAFTLPMIDKLKAGRSKARMPRALVIAPTRELADQVAASFEKYAKGQKLSWVLLIGGVSFTDQELKLDRGVDVVIATPGRLLDHFQRGKLLMTGVQIMVVDEADRMLDMGFIPDIERIFQLTPAKKQTLFFSATMPPEITRLTKQFLKDPVRIEASRPATAGENIAQHLVRIPSTDPKAKRTALRALIDGANVVSGLVFCNRKSEVDVVAKSLRTHGHDAAPIHGDLDQQTRMRTLEAFRKGELKLLVASDVAARGLDIPAVSHVFNFDVPHHADDYVHRIGRTGRAGRSGDTFMIVTPADSRNLDKVLKLIGTKPDEVTLDIDFASIKDEPRAGRGERGGRGRERSAPKRDHAPREPHPRHQQASTAPIEQPAEPTPRPARSRRRPEPAEAGTPVAVVEAAPVEVAPAREAPVLDERVREQPVREASREPQRAQRNDRGERDRAPRGPRERPERDRPQRDRPERQGRDRDADDGGSRVLGFGDDTPAFLTRASTPPPAED